MTNENYKLRNLIKDMLFDRTLFNFYWNKIVNNLRDRRKFLLDMIERSNQAFNQGADFLDNLKKLQSRRAADREFHVSEMINMERKIDANQIMNLFLGGKGKKRVMAPLEAREIRRRDDFKSEYSERLNLYNGVIENIKKLTGVPDIKNAVDFYMREENEGFQFYTYLNEMNHQIEYLTSNYSKYSMEVWTSQDYYSRKLKYFEQRIDDLHKQLHDEINKTLALKDDRDKYDSNIAVFLDTIFEILKILKCDCSSVEKLLADHKKVTVFNMQTFLTLLENRMNEILAYVYCDQRKNSADIIVDDAKLTVKSLKRTQEERLCIEDVITTQQCAECAEGEDVNRYDEKTVYPLDHEAIEEIMREKVKAPGMTFRLHNLSKCNLPRSGVIMGRRYAE
jgi:coiled-coil domain-containing protein 63/114